MDDPSRLPSRVSHRATLAGDGRFGPIEERLGRRLLRLVDPRSEEGAGLLDEGRVDLTGPDGEHLGRVPPADAYRSLLERLEARLAEVREDPDRACLAQEIDRLKARAPALKAPR